jgi:hypothetical protein
VKRDKQEVDCKAIELAATVDALTAELGSLQVQLMAEVREDDDDFEPEGDAETPTLQPLGTQSTTLTILPTKENGRRYKRDFIMKIQDLVQKFNIRGNNIDKLLHSTLHIFTGEGPCQVSSCPPHYQRHVPDIPCCAGMPGKSMGELQQLVPLMKKSQMYLHGEVVGRLQITHLSQTLKDNVDMPFFVLEVDEGKIQNIGRMAALATYADAGDTFILDFDDVLAMLHASALTYHFHVFTRDMCQRQGTQCGIWYRQNQFQGHPVRRRRQLSSG